MVAIGEKVRVHYVGTLDDGSEFDNSRKRGELLEFVVGADQVINGFDKAVFEMEQGEKRTVRLEPVEAYGEWREDFVEQVPCELLPNWEQLPIGQPIVLRAQNGEEIQVTCMKIEDGIVYLDHNHPLAGKAINFEIELVEVMWQSAIERERHASGCACGCHEFKEAITRQNAEAAMRAETDACGCGHDHGHDHSHCC